MTRDKEKKLFPDQQIQEEYCPHCGQYTAGETMCPNCGMEIFGESGLFEHEEDEMEGDE